MTKINPKEIAEKLGATHVEKINKPHVWMSAPPEFFVPTDLCWPDFVENMRIEDDNPFIQAINLFAMDLKNKTNNSVGAKLIIDNHPDDNFVFYKLVIFPMSSKYLKYVLLHIHRDKDIVTIKEVYKNGDSYPIMVKTNKDLYDILMRMANSVEVRNQIIALI